jgi:LysR family transcriptional regulator, glycine cleavage system transcriptional activator
MPPPQITSPRRKPPIALPGNPAPNRAFPPFGVLRAFDAVARLGGVNSAAKALSVSRAMINRRLRLLEAWTGAALINRTRNEVGLTEEGRRYHEMLSPHIEGIASATLSLVEPRRDDTLNIWCVPGFASLWLMPRLERFREANPGLYIELRAEEAAPNFSRPDADLAIRYSPEYGSGYVAAEGRLAQLPTNVRILELAHLPLLPVASPSYLAASPPISTPRDLLAQTLIQEENSGWRPWFAAFEVHEEPGVGGLKLWQHDLAMSAAQRGHGVALADRFSAGDDLAAGRLVEVIGADGPFPPVLFGSYLLIARPDRWNARPVARFRHWIHERIKSELRALQS